MSRTYKEAAANIKACNCSSGWIQRALVDLEDRDCVDAYYDALALAALAKRRMDEALNKGIS